MYELRIPYPLLRVYILLFIIAVGCIVTLGFMYGRVYLRALQANVLERRNRDLEEKYAKLVYLEKKVAELKRESERLKELLGVSATPPPVEIESGTSSTRSKTKTSAMSTATGVSSPELAEFLLTEELESKKLPTLLPVQGWVSRRFSDAHPGVDIVAAPGTPVISTMSGKVVGVRWDDVLGNVVEIESDIGYRTVYGHLQTVFVEKDKLVEQGDVIGLLGSTGKSTGPHIHYEVLFKGKRCNPLVVATKYRREER